MDLTEVTAVLPLPCGTMAATAARTARGLFSALALGNDLFPVWMGGPNELNVLVLGLRKIRW